MKIMLVDDSRTMRGIQKNLLNQMGHQDIIEATDGLDAMSRVLAEKPNLILLDWNMPNMDGLTFLKQYRTHNKTTSVVMVTTEAEKTRVVEALQFGATSYIIKPFTPEHFKERVAKVAEKIAA